MHSANNASERAIRIPVMQHTVRMDVRTEKGMRVMATIMTRMKTWWRRGQDPDTMLLKLPRET